MDYIELDRQDKEIVSSLLLLSMELTPGGNMKTSLSRVRNFLEMTESSDINSDEADDPKGVISRNDAAIVRYAMNVYEMLCRGRYESLKEKYNIDIMDDVDRVWMNKAIELIPDELYEAGYLKRLSKKLKGKKVPSRKLYISDLHFYHNRLCEYMDKRGFANSDEMNQHMIQVWNENVTEKDEIFILGDFSIGRGKQTNEVLSQLSGKKYLVVGNHDRFLDDKDFDTSLFEWIKPYAEIGDNGRQLILSHYPIFCYKGQYRIKPDGTSTNYMLYGHVHNTHDEVLVNQFIEITKRTFVMSKNVTEPTPIPCNMINCFCMFSNYIPLTLDEWIVLDAKRRREMSE